ncbi:MAG: hypothetical protein ISR72_09875 [Methylobacter sp.]|nr:hypothetical protein [Methylobacter sp.]
MKIVIQCAATKNLAQPGAGFLTTDKRLVQFVAQPELAPFNEQYAYAHPDDLSDGRQTWRERLSDYNNGTPSNPLHLLPAYRLYVNSAYENLVKKFGAEQVFILSAGWGLISANFLTPDYDITFSKAKNVEPYCRRSKSDTYSDLCQLPDDGESIVFLGGKDYLPLFCMLTRELKGMKKVFFNSSVDPNLGHGFCSERFITTKRTNWHYSCAQALIDGKIGI